MKIPLAWIVCVLCLIAVVVMLFNEGFTNEDLQNKHFFMSVKGRDLCEQQRLQYVEVHPLSFDEWEVVCSTISPYKLIRHRIGK